MGESNGDENAKLYTRGVQEGYGGEFFVEADTVGRASAGEPLYRITERGMEVVREAIA